LAQSESKNNPIAEELKERERMHAEITYNNCTPQQKIIPYLIETGRSEITYKRERRYT